MRKFGFLVAGAMLATLAVPLAAQAQGVPGGVSYGVYEGGRVAGPVGAVVGGVVGGVIGGVEGVLGISPAYQTYSDQPPPPRQYRIRKASRKAVRHSRHVRHS